MMLSRLYQDICYVEVTEATGKVVPGGVLLYTIDSIPLTLYNSYDNGICQAITCVFSSIKTFISVVYRPLDASIGSFFQKGSSVPGQNVEN